MTPLHYFFERIQIMKKENKEISPQETKEKHFPNMSDPVPPKPKKKKRRRKKQKKLLKAPTDILRLCMVWGFIIAVFLLSTKFVTITLYVAEDHKMTFDKSAIMTSYPDQKAIDESVKEMDAALKGLKNNDIEKRNENMAIQTAKYDWKYHIAEGVNIDELVKKINEAQQVDIRLYTEESVEALNNATMDAMHKLKASVTISQSILQMLLGGRMNNVTSIDIGNVIKDTVLIYALAVLPIAGFFICTFDKHYHFKNIYSLLASLLCILDIFSIIWPHIGLGAVLSIFLYAIIASLSIAAIYAKQQEDHLIKNPELEPEYTEKHPYFLKALINHKTLSLIHNSDEPTEKEKTLNSAKNAKEANKTGSKNKNKNTVKGKNDSGKGNKNNNNKRK